MDHFAFYELPRSFQPDAAAVKRRYYQNSKRFHPDFYTLESEAKQTEILEQSTRNNEAYRTLSDPDRRMAYLLRLEGALTEGDGSSVPQDFLLRMMDINEGLMELELDPDPAAHARVSAQLDTLLAELQATLQPALDQYDREPAARPAALAVIKDYYLKHKYLLRIRENLDKFAPA